MNFETPNQRMEKLEEQVQRALANHKVKELVNTEHVQLYRCQKPGTWVYGFDIILSPTCITVSGDIGEVLYTVGRDMGFLAKDGCSGYGLGKLEQVYRDKKEVNDFLVADYLYSLIYEYFELGTIESSDLPDEIKEPSALNQDNPKELAIAINSLFCQVIEVLYENEPEELPEWLRQIKANEDEVENIYYLFDQLRHHDYKPSEQELYNIIHNNNLCEIDPDWWERGLTVIDWHVLWVCACAEFAAKQWLEQDINKAA